MKKYSLFLILICFVGFGCATTLEMESKLNEAKGKDTFDAYAEFLTTYQSENSLVNQAKTRMVDIFNQNSIKKFEVMFLDFENTAVDEMLRGTGRPLSDISYFGGKPYLDGKPLLPNDIPCGKGNLEIATNDDYKLYENNLKGFILETLERKGYSTQLGGCIGINSVKAITTDWGSKYKIPLSVRDRYHTKYYLAAETFLKPQNQDIDAILIFLISYVRHRLSNIEHIVIPGGYETTPNLDPVRSPSDLENWIITNDLNALEFSYHIYDLKSKKRIFADVVGCKRKNNYDENYARSVFIVRWNYTESENEFCKRCITELFKNLPEVK